MNVKTEGRSWHITEEPQLTVRYHNLGSKNQRTLIDLHGAMFVAI